MGINTKMAYSETVEQIVRKATGQLDRSGSMIFLGDTVRKHNIYGEYFEGVVVFVNCAYRIHISKGFTGEVVKGDDCLKHNYSLLYDEIRGTRDIEVIKIQGAR